MFEILIITIVVIVPLFCYLHYKFYKEENKLEGMKIVKEDNSLVGVIYALLSSKVEFCVSVSGSKEAKTWSYYPSGKSCSVGFNISMVSLIQEWEKAEKGD
jgi:Trk-type K+ transport system membrane component